MRTAKTQFPSKVLFFRNLPPGATQDDLVAACCGEGKVLNALKLRDKNQGFVEYEDVESAHQFMQRHTTVKPCAIRNQPVDVEFSIKHQELTVPPQTDEPPYVLKEQPNRILLVSIRDTSHPVDCEILHKLFTATGGQVQKIVCFEKSGQNQAFVELQDVPTAISCRNTLNGHSVFIDGSILKIDFSRLHTLNVRSGDAKSRDYTLLNVIPLAPIPTTPASTLPTPMPSYPTSYPMSGIGNPTSPVGNLTISPADNYMVPSHAHTHHTTMNTHSHTHPHVHQHAHAHAPATVPPNIQHTQTHPSFGVTVSNTSLHPHPQPVSPQTPTISTWSAIAPSQTLPTSTAFSGIAGAPLPSVTSSPGILSSAPSGGYPGSVGITVDPTTSVTVGNAIPLSGADMSAGTISVGPALPVQPSKTKVLIVSNLADKDCTPQILFKLFGTCGDVMRVKILYKKRNTALIQFADEHQAEVALRNLNGVQLFNQPLSVSLSRLPEVPLPPQNEKESKYGGLTEDFSHSKEHRFHRPGCKNATHIMAPTSMLHVSSLPKSITEEQLKTQFLRFGSVESVKWFNKDKAPQSESIKPVSPTKPETKMCLLKMDSIPSAVTALVHLHGTKLTNSPDFPPRGVQISFSNAGSATTVRSRADPYVG
eukprot:TRINITY_DN54616_c0_g1_i1.p1 TRINITY_DN54616_c0_g1~~TRINITY_DN54616_c0_g1_i1.p1  ORF type:complete len:649 (-),score=19.63 TRINITY_DN54616_c0_g1_i1:106-2052(-)